MVSPSQKCHAAQGVVAAGLCSRRQACRYLGLTRSSCAYRPRPPTERRVRTESAIVALSRRHSRYGYRRIHALVERQGHRCARRTVQRVRRQEGLRVTGPSRRPKCPPRTEAKIRSEGLNDVWCLDLVFDVTSAGTTIKFLTIVDEGFHYCIDIVASRQPGAAEVIRALQTATKVHGSPRHLRFDNGGKFVARPLQEWLAQAGIRIRFIEPGSPWRNGVNESFNGRFRDECLNRELLGSVLEAQVIARAFREEYNTEQPHSSIGYQVPAEYRSLLLGQALGSGQSLPARPSLTTTLNPNHNLPRLSPEVVQNRDSGLREPL
jgi:putative transposase